ncbi:hypothetical protein [Bradyrhizobium sp. SZCCHNRI1029]|uniref:hypothetical protein n=1 Tax=Bradyrhizobium sp. SZCCHNRI1029 TaxID=3057278 RepID=UPI0029164615|nr:hypothetical protein [Bradyrhizobium sp. SZCCHNRI1029]
MRTKLVIAMLLSFGVIVLGHAYLRGYAPFTAQFVQTCDRAIKERLVDPSTYERISVDESRKTITFDEFFKDPIRRVSEAAKKAIAQVERASPVQYIALIDYQAQDRIGAIIRESATCTFNSLDGSDMPERTGFVQVDGEHNITWAARQPNAAALLSRLGR